MKQLSDLAGKLGIQTNSSNPDNINPDELIEAITGKFVELQSHVVESNKRSAEQLIKFALNEGRITPELADTFLSFAAEDYDACKRFLDNAPVISSPLADSGLALVPTSSVGKTGCVTPVRRYELLNEGIDINTLEYQEILKDPYKYGRTLTEEEIDLVRQR